MEEKKINIINAKYTGCGHTVRCTSESIATTNLECTGKCPPCKNVPLFVYLFEGVYHVHFPAQMQPAGMGSLGIPTNYASPVHIDYVIEQVNREYPMRRVLAARVISTDEYAAMQQDKKVERDEHGLERARLDEAQALTYFVVRNVEPKDSQVEA